MSQRGFFRSALSSVGLTLLLTSSHPAVAQTQPPIAVGGNTTQRLEAARALVPLLQDVKRRAQPGVNVQPGSVPDSPFAGAQTTLFAFTLSKRSVPADSRVIAAIDRLLAWNGTGQGGDDTAVLFDQWLGELTAKSAGAVLFAGKGVCDTACVVQRMTNLDDTWGATTKNRAEMRDETLLDALVAVVTK